MKKVKIFSLILMPQIQQYIVILEELTGTRLVPIWIGVNEGNAIALHMEKHKLPRPMTHDLIADIFNTTGIKIDKVVINDLKDNTYYATIHMKSNAKIHLIDARPSDSIALAVRTGSPIYIDEKVLDKCPIIRKPITDTEVKDFKTKLKSLKPEDFFKKS